MEKHGAIPHLSCILSESTKKAKITLFCVPLNFCPKKFQTIQNMIHFAQNKLLLMLNGKKIILNTCNSRKFHWSMKNWKFQFSIIFHKKYQFFKFFTQFNPFNTIILLKISLFSHFYHKMLVWGQIWTVYDNVHFTIWFHTSNSSAN